METIANYPMNVTDCYKCGYFRKGGHFTCQKFPHPHNVEHPADDAKAKEAFNKVCGWLYNYPWFNKVADEFIKALEE